MKRVCCLIVTYNRCNCLKTLLDSLDKQTYPIDGLIIVNNSSTDNTVSFLQENKIINKEDLDKENNSIWKERNIIFYNSSINSGGAGGFRKGFEIAIKNIQNYDYFWIMDDDVQPRFDCLEKLIMVFDEKHQVCVPRRIGIGFNDSIIVKYRFNNPFVYTLLSRGVSVNKIEKDKYEVKTFTFEGPLLSSSLIKKIGLPNDRYFLQGDDYDYAFRCLRKTSIYYVPSAIIDRQLPIVKKSSQENNYWRLYYSIRNMSLLDLNYARNRFIGRVRVLNNQIHWFFVGIKHKNPIERKIVKRAFKDAIKGIDGKTILPGEI